MSFQRTLTAALMLSIAVAGCSKDELPRAQNPASSGEGGHDGGSGGQAQGGDGGAVIPDTECVEPAIAGVEVYAAPGLNLQHLAAVGDRWLASGPDGYALFDRDGSNPDPVPESFAPNFNIIGPEGQTGGIAASGVAIQYLRVDQDGGAELGPVGVALEEPLALTVASNAGDALVVWAFNTRLTARGIDAAGTVGSEVDVTFGAYSTFIFLASAAREGQVGLAWTGDAALGQHTTFFQLADAGGAVGDTLELYQTSASHNLIGVAATTQGFVLLLTGEPPENRPLLMTLDETGAPTSDVVTLEGAQSAHDIASLGDSFAVVAMRDTGEPELRTFGLDLQPQAAWVCLGTDVDPSRPSAVAVDGSGYAALHTTVAGQVTLHRLDALGTGAP